MKDIEKLCILFTTFFLNLKLKSVKIKVYLVYNQNCYFERQLEIVLKANIM